MNQETQRQIERLGLAGRLERLTGGEFVQALNAKRYPKGIRIFEFRRDVWVTEHYYINEQVVVGSDDNQYICKLAHTSTLNDMPITGGNWTTYWQPAPVCAGVYFCVEKSLDPLEWLDPSGESKFNDMNEKGVAVLNLGECDAGSTGDGALVEGDLLAVWPIAAEKWQGEVWFIGTVYTKDISFVVGTDNNVYQCKISHKSNIENKPITGSQWSTYWDIPYTKKYFVGLPTKAIGTSVDIEIYEVQSPGSGKGIYNCKRQLLNESQTDKFIDSEDEEVEVLNLYESDGESGTALAAGDRLAAWQMETEALSKEITYIERYEYEGEIWVVIAVEDVTGFEEGDTIAVADVPVESFNGSFTIEEIIAEANEIYYKQTGNAENSEGGTATKAGVDKWIGVPIEELGGGSLSKIFEIQGNATGDGLYNCFEQNLKSNKWDDTKGDDRFADKDAVNVIVLNLLESHIAEPNNTTVAVGNTSSSFTITDGPASNDYYNYWQITVTDADDGNKETRTITDYTSSKVVTVGTAFSFIPAASDEVSITPAWMLAAGDRIKAVKIQDFFEQAITSITRSSGTVTVTVSDTSGFVIGRMAIIDGVTDSSFDGTFEITAKNASTITYSQAGDDGSSSGGTATAEPYDRWVGLPMVRENRRAKIKSVSATYYICKLLDQDDAEVGDNITVYPQNHLGDNALDGDVLPLLVVDEIIPVYHSQDSKWYWPGEIHDSDNCQDCF